MLLNISGLFINSDYIHNIRTSPCNNGQYALYVDCTYSEKPLILYANTEKEIEESKVKLLQFLTEHGLLLSVDV